MAQGPDGNFYGTTQNGGSSDYATVFQITTNGTLTTLDTLTNYGANPSALTLGKDSNFYGTTSGGQGYGTVFQVTTTGAFTTLAYFNFTNGYHP